MNTKEYIDSLFAGYEDTAELLDFKEELQSNLEDRIREMVNKGMDQTQAFLKATAQLGDISEIANQISLDKKQQVLEEMFMKTRSYMSPKRVRGYIVLAGILLFGFIVSALSYFGDRDMQAVIGSMIPFGVFPAGALVYLSLTQETASSNPMGRKRALCYASGAAVLLFGLLVFLLTYFMDGMGAMEAVATLIPFVLPSGLFLAFLILTEKPRHKPWVMEQQSRWMEHHAKAHKNPERMMKRGLLSGALWISTVALFCLLFFGLNIHIAWVVFLFAVAAEILIEYFQHSQQ